MHRGRNQASPQARPLRAAASTRRYIPDNRPQAHEGLTEHFDEPRIVRSMVQERTGAPAQTDKLAGTQQRSNRDRSESLESALKDSYRAWSPCIGPVAVSRRQRTRGVSIMFVALANELADDAERRSKASRWRDPRAGRRHGLLPHGSNVVTWRTRPADREDPGRQSPTPAPATVGVQLDEFEDARPSGHRSGTTSSTRT